MSMKSQLTDAMKEAMRAKNKERLGAIRLILAEIKRIEVDERIEIDDARVLTVLDKMVKQRRDSITQYESAGRQELADIEIAEINVIQDFLPTALTEKEINQLVQTAISDTGASSMADMGKVMGMASKEMAGKADGKTISTIVKQILNT